MAAAGEIGGFLSGEEVIIRSPGHWAEGEWGIVRHIDRDGRYHVVLWDGDDAAVVFNEDELESLTLKFRSNRRKPLTR